MFHWVDFLTKGHYLLLEMLEVNLINDVMGFSFLLDESHEDGFLEKTQIIHC